MRVWAGRFK